MKNTLSIKLESQIDKLPTFEKRMAAEGILGLLLEDAISEREAIRQLKVNGIVIA